MNDGRGGWRDPPRRQTQRIRDWIEGLDYLDVLRLVDVSFRLGANRGKRCSGEIRKIVGEIDVEDLRIPYTAVAADLTNQQET